MRARLYFSKEKWRCPVPVLLLFKGLILTVLGVLGECRVHNRPGLCSQLSTTKNAVGAGGGEGAGMFSTMACLKHYQQPIFHHESWFKTTALGHKNQLLTTSSGTTIPSMFPSNVDSMINIHPLSSLIISLHSFFCNFPLTGVVFVEQLVGKTERAELLYTSCEGKKPSRCSVSAQNHS